MTQSSTKSLQTSVMKSPSRKKASQQGGTGAKSRTHKSVSQHHSIEEAKMESNRQLVNELLSPNTTRIQHASEIKKKKISTVCREESILSDNAPDAAKIALRALFR